ncbi:hypothetical protein NQ318_011473 [Aromia moschata]|uniref:Peptidase A2 domain-containing protein n=1 Tax=Aromia moschata TaxID=1265417 RepID=A0AAV8X304_9CUCU|nr:hypothetical protein NQ318_011473 [Aromia moschata]
MKKKPKLEDVIKIFDKYCEPYKFLECTQKPNQLLLQYITELKSLSSACEYQESENMVRDKVVMGIRDNILREKLLQNDNLALAKAEEMCQIYEQKSSDDDFFIDCLTLNDKKNVDSKIKYRVCKLNTKKLEIVENIYINNQLVDTGAECNILPAKIFEKVAPNAEQLDVDVNLTAYGGSRIEVQGSAHHTAETDIKNFNTRNHIIDNNTNIKEWYNEYVQDKILSKLEEFQEPDSGRWSAGIRASSKEEVHGLLSKSHSSANLSSELNSIAEEWGVKQKIMLAVSDNAPNITSAIKNGTG